MKDKKEVGVLVARMQPLHNAHLYLVNKILEECEQCVIVLGSENKYDMIRNPFDIRLREVILRECFKSDENSRITIFTLPDWSMESDTRNYEVWGDYLYYNIVSRIQKKHINYYYSDDPEIMLRWISDNTRPYINCVFLERAEIFEGLSATKIRKAFEEDDREYINKYCPNSVSDRYNMLKEMWRCVRKNPKSDFSMK